MCLHVCTVYIFFSLNNKAVTLSLSLSLLSVYQYILPLTITRVFNVFTSFPRTQKAKIPFSEQHVSMCRNNIYFIHVDSMYIFRLFSLCTYMLWSVTRVVSFPLLKVLADTGQELIFASSRLSLNHWVLNSNVTLR